MLEALVVLLVFVVFAIVAVISRAPEKEIVTADSPEVPAGPPKSARVATSGPPFWMILIAACGLAAGLHLGLGLYPLVAAAAASVFGVALNILFVGLATRRSARLETQLADSIDLMVSGLRSGGSLVDSLASATQSTPRPLHAYFQEWLDRIRLGEAPESVLADLEERLPLESFRLFSITVASHWQGGGSLATSLSNVGRTIRDRVDVARRVRSQTVETHASVISVLVVTYGLALLMWNNYPERFNGFASSELGAMFIGLTVLLQAVGLFWISRMTRIEV